MNNAARWISFMLAGGFFYAGALIAFDVDPLNFPLWRTVAGTLLFCLALVMWDRA